MPARIPSRPVPPKPSETPPALKKAVRAASKLLTEYPTHVFLPREIERLLTSNRTKLHVPDEVPTREFLAALLKETALRKVALKPVPPSEYEAPVRYVWGEVSPLKLAISLRAGSYLSHASAVFLHGLSQQIPKTIYVNKEQSPKPVPSVLPTQETIDRAFRNQPRVSKYLFQLDGFTVTLLSGKNTGRLEVTRVTEAGETLDVTKLERTLIDIAVRPVYAGGVFEVLRIYRATRDRVAVNTLVSTLKRLQYVYPYHQAIGFYMERAGFPPKHLEKLRALGMKFRFYLTNRMQNPKFSDSWQLFFPEGL